jgi:hypothetical protein
VPTPTVPASSADVPRPRPIVSAIALPTSSSAAAWRRDSMALSTVSVATM